MSDGNNQMNTLKILRSARLLMYCMTRYQESESMNQGDLTQYIEVDSQLLDQTILPRSHRHRQHQNEF
jgi:hypothetical protein